MDDQKRAFLFGDLPDGVDTADPDRWSELLGRDESYSPAHAAVRHAVASQIAQDDPPETWQHASRLLSQGHERLDVMRQLVISFTPHLIRVLEDADPFDRSAYLASLADLPLPTGVDVERAVLDVARAAAGVSFDGLVSEVAQRVGSRADDPAVAAWIDRVAEDLMDPDGPLELVARDRVVHVEALAERVVLTHRLTQQERDTGFLPVSVDLAGFRRLQDLSLPDGQELTVSAEGWSDPSWLEPFPVGSVLAVGVRDGVVSVTVLAETPDVDTALVARLRDEYDAAVEEPWLPVPIEELVLAVVATDGAVFATPAAPLTDLLAAAGLDVRGSEVAHESSVWATVELVRRQHRLYDRLGPGYVLDATQRVLDAVGGELDHAAARRVLDELDDPAVLEVVTAELLGLDGDPERVAATGRLAEGLLAAASRPSQRAVALWLRSVVAERRGRLDEAEEDLRAAVRLDPQWPPAVDRAAWYRSDRGDVVGALALWRSLDMTSAESDDVRELEDLPVVTHPPLGRNDRCWCGSGRKYKQCHLGRPQALPLPDRVGWLCRKASGYLERAGGEAQGVVVEHVMARAVDPEDQGRIVEAVQDPLVLDVVLHESGWFERFLEDRGALLPEDEALLATAWLLVARTVYEVVESRPRSGVTVRDLRTGDLVQVRERTFSTAARPGQRICARAVPDGESHQFIGGLFEVAPGRERDLLGLLDDGDGIALLSYVADLHRPPVVVGPDGRVIELPDLPSGPRPSPLVPPPEVTREIVEAMEQRWCEEPVPALGGVTPLEAAADPTRRDDVVRLIASFPRIDPATGAFGLRPEALLDRLGLPPSS